MPHITFYPGPVNKILRKSRRPLTAPQILHSDLGDTISFQMNRIFDVKWKSSKMLFINNNKCYLFNKFISRSWIPGANWGLNPQIQQLHLGCTQHFCGSTESPTSKGITQKQWKKNLPQWSLMPSNNLEGEKKRSIFGTKEIIPWIPSFLIISFGFNSLGL